MQPAVIRDILILQSILSLTELNSFLMAELRFVDYVFELIVQEQNSCFSQRNQTY